MKTFVTIPRFCERHPRGILGKVQSYFRGIFYWFHHPGKRGFLGKIGSLFVFHHGKGGRAMKESLFRSEHCVYIIHKRPLFFAKSMEFFGGGFGLGELGFSGTWLEFVWVGDLVYFQ